MTVERRQNNEHLKRQISRMRIEQNAVILAHYYQVPEIQDIADFVGDSLALAQEAAKTDADTIVFAGVHFMAETAKILNPEKKVLLPDLAAGCSLADSCPPEDFRAFVSQHPDHIVVSYINCTAEVKTLSDIVCTSSNAVKIINSIPENTPIIFAPDVNLGRYLIKETGRNMKLWNGACIVHEAFDLEKIVKLKAEHPNAKIIAHPESEDHILNVANFIGSTAALLKYAVEDDAQTYIVATEHGIIHKMSQQIPNKLLIPAPGVEDNTCACSECAFMKMNTLQKLHDCLKFGTPEITLDKDIIKQARLSIDRMFEITNQTSNTQCEQKTTTSL
tara:strand:+ start:54 stop:1052 length:999 start_codon:yes stop_codon:yes gene_type:complete